MLVIARNMILSIAGTHGSPYETIRDTQKQCSTYSNIWSIPTSCIVQWASKIAGNYCPQTLKHSNGCYLPYQNSGIQTGISIRLHIIGNQDQLLLNALDTILLYMAPNKTTIQPFSHLYGGNDMTDKIHHNLLKMQIWINHLRHDRVSWLICSGGIVHYDNRGCGTETVLAATLPISNKTVYTEICDRTIKNKLASGPLNKITIQNTWFEILFHELTHGVLDTDDGPNQDVYGIKKCCQWSEQIKELLQSKTEIPEDITIAADCLAIVANQIHIKAPPPKCPTVHSSSRKMYINSFINNNEVKTMTFKHNDTQCQFNILDETDILFAEYSILNLYHTGITISSTATLTHGVPQGTLKLTGPQPYICHTGHIHGKPVTIAVPPSESISVKINLFDICGFNKQTATPGLYTLSMKGFHHVHTDDMSISSDLSTCDSTVCPSTYLNCRAEILITKPTGLLNVAVDESL